MCVIDILGQSFDMQSLTRLNETTTYTFNVLLADIAISSMLLGVSTYLLSALIFHKIKAKKMQGNFMNLPLGKRYGMISAYICIIISIVSVIRQANSLAQKLLEWRELAEEFDFEESFIDKKCNILATVGNCAITIGTGFVYLFLWFRQRALYVHPSLKILSNKIIKLISFSIIVVWLIIFVCLMASYFSLVQHHFEKIVGCVVDKSVYDSYTYLIISWTIVSIVMQIGLLFLFLYPIFKSSLWRSGLRQNEQNISLFKRVKKAVALSSICLATDILTIILRAVLINRNGSIVLSIFSTNLVINHLMTIACFDHWKELLWPWKFCFKNTTLSDGQQRNNTI